MCIQMCFEWLLGCCYVVMWIQMHFGWLLGCCYVVPNVFWVVPKVLLYGCKCLSGCHTVAMRFQKRFRCYLWL